MDNGITEMTSLGRVLNIPLSPATVSRWQQGVMPRNSTLKAIADYFRVDVAYLVNEDSLPPQGAPFESIDLLPLTPQEEELLKMFRNASEIGKMRMIHQIVAIWEQEPSHAHE